LEKTIFTGTSVWGYTVVLMHPIFNRGAKVHFAPQQERNFYEIIERLVPVCCLH